MVTGHGRRPVMMVRSPLTTPTCEELAGRVVTGDRTAFALLVERHLPRTVLVAQRVLLRRAEAEDVAQDVFVRFWQKPSLYQPNRAKFTTWLYRVTINRALDVTRRVKPLPLEYGLEQPDPAPGAFEEMARLQRRQALRQAVAALPARQRAALALSYQSGLSDQEAAAALEITIGAYESLLVRARRTLRETMLKDGHHDAG